MQQLTRWTPQLRNGATSDQACATHSLLSVATLAVIMVVSCGTGTRSRRRTAAARRMRGIGPHVVQARQRGAHMDPGPERQGYNGMRLSDAGREVHALQPVAE